MILKTRRLLILPSALILFIGAASQAAALNWSRIGKGGLAKSYNMSQPAPTSWCVFQGKLHFGTGGGGGNGGQVWSYDGKAWALVHKPKPGGTSRIGAVGSLAVLGDYLYAGMDMNNSTCQLWRTKGGGAKAYAWTRVSGPANIERQGLYELRSMAAVKGALYLGLTSNRGCQIWKFDGASWTQLVGQGAAGSPTGPGFGSQENYSALCMAVSAAGDLYVGTARFSGGEVWRLSGSTWTKINKPGFGSAKNYYVNFLVYFENSLYAGTQNEDKGAQVWKYVGPGPSNWKAVGLNGMGDAENRGAVSAAVFGNPGFLYVITQNSRTGCQVLRTNGKKWEKACAPGFGEGTVNSWGSQLSAFGGKLYAGVDSEFGGRVFATNGGAKVPFAWSQVSEDGFTSNDNEEIRSAAVYAGSLYVGTVSRLGCEVWRYESKGWARVASGGFDDPYNYAAESMAVSSLGLHVATYNGMTGAEIWRYNGTKWTQANADGFGDDSNSRADSMFVHTGKLYVGTHSYDTKAKVWRCDGPGTGQWTKVNNPGFGVSHTVGVLCFATLNGKLYAGTYDSNDPCRVWRFDGPGPSGWTAVSEEGFGDNANHGVNGLAVYQGALYAIVWNARMTGAEIWRYSGSGTSWTKVNQNGFGTKDNSTAYGMTVFGNLLYIGTSNHVSGGQIWTYDGSAWAKEGLSGFGTNNNGAIVVLASDGHNLYAGTENSAFGCEVWTTGAGNDSPVIRLESPFSAAPGAGRPFLKKRLEIAKKTR